MIAELLLIPIKHLLDIASNRLQAVHRAQTHFNNRILNTPSQRPVVAARLQIKAHKLFNKLGVLADIPSKMLLDQVVNSCLQPVRVRIPRQLAVNRAAHLVLPQGHDKDIVLTLGLAQFSQALQNCNDCFHVEQVVLSTRGRTGPENFVDVAEKLDASFNERVVQLGVDTLVKRMRETGLQDAVED